MNMYTTYFSTHFILFFTFIVCGSNLSAILINEYWLIDWLIDSQKDKIVNCGAGIGGSIGHGWSHVASLCETRKLYSNDISYRAISLSHCFNNWRSAPVITVFGWRPSVRFPNFLHQLTRCDFSRVPFSGSNEVGPHQHLNGRLMKLVPSLVTLFSQTALHNYAEDQRSASACQCHGHRSLVALKPCPGQ